MWQSSETVQNNIECLSANLLEYIFLKNLHMFSCECHLYVYFSLQTHLQQLQQLQQLQALLLQHIANEASANTNTAGSGVSTAGTADSADSIGGGASGGESGASQVPASKSDGTQTTHAETALQVSA